ncbi:MAG: hypothetical protein AVDCRST_MAG70-314 [uncultured Thermomicrobiales bacterium]|uniref:Uncharacterized protein n=1 Tax=uncultured Thermomicrobiales bacterium TaxID=1645740 RepID=A0A6J4U875_9BACT|nr:MAG: hypothetical protein AVDCRST_MAG70-314 [uncultured Thermomicrobiales bacterium]
MGAKGHGDARPSHHHPPSALDEFLRLFLTSLASRPDGYRPAADGAALAAEHGWPEAFSQAMFDSAFGRRLIEPYQPRPKLVRWRISRRGREWLADATTAEPPVAQSTT